MKKIFYTALSFAVIMLVSCGGNESKTAEKETPQTAPVEEVVEESVEEIIEEEAPSTETASTEGNADNGKEFFNSKGCVACHQAAVKTVGPALNEIAKAYADNNEGLTAFLKAEGEAIVDPAQAAIMQPQLDITKALPQEELNDVVTYILSNK
ncbi:MAG: c-type cytochrome [Vicingaceae bacterium]